jgi:L-fuculose-phosphate aldolase
MINLHKVKQEICEIGDRIYKKGFAAANDGNISYRVSENEVVCTPTQICKGFMKPDDLCVVDMEGKQIAGHRKRTSEVMLHLAIMKARPEVKSVVHCHPPHATAFGIAREPIPQCVIPEVEIFLGDVPITKYAIPGGQEFADTVLPFVHKSNVVILANHGTVSYGETVERAYWWTEILDAYCRILMLSHSLGRVNYFTEPEAQALLDLKGKWGFKDPRNEMKNCDICANDVFRDSWKDTGVSPHAFNPPQFRSAQCSAQPASAPSANGAASNGAGAVGANGAAVPPEMEALVQAITDRVMAALNGRK